MFCATVIEEAILRSDTYVHVVLGILNWSPHIV